MKPHGGKAGREVLISGVFPGIDYPTTPDRERVECAGAEFRIGQQNEIRNDRPSSAVK